MLFRSVAVRTRADQEVLFVQNNYSATFETKYMCSASLEGATEAPIRVYQTTVKAGQQTQLSISLLNAGRADLDWSLAASNGWIDPAADNGTLSAESTAELGLRIDATAARAGSQLVGYVTIAGAEGSHTLKIVVDVTP